MEHLKPFDLSGKTILVTGASSGIGRQVAITCAQFGATIVLTGRNAERLNGTMAQLVGKGHVSIQADLTDPTGTDKIVTASPQLDGVFISAGVVNPFPIKFINEEKYRETIDINFKSVVMLLTGITRARKLNAESSLVFMSSVAAFAPHKGSAMYSASKAAIEAYSRVFAIEYASHKIRANCISAGMVNTPMFDYSAKGAASEVMDQHLQQYPLGMGQPQDIALAAIYFLSPASRWVTGSKLVIDGGLTMGI